MVHTYNLPHGIQVHRFGDSWSIVSALKVLPMEEEDVAWNFAIDAIESLILNHAKYGIDVSADTYKSGIEMTLKSLRK